MKIAKIHLNKYVRQSVVLLGSTRFTLVQLIGLVAAILMYYQEFPHANLILLASFSLAVCNLLCAMFTQNSIKNNPVLLVFHLALVVLVILAGVGQLTYLKGRLELTEGIVFQGDLLELDEGFLHRNSLDEIKFQNLGFEVDYKPGLKRNRTNNTIAWTDSNGQDYVSVIGDQHPLVIDGYRFYTSFNKGYSLLFTWQDAQGSSLGSVHLPSFPAREFEQAQFWNLPGSDFKIWTQLVPHQKIVKLDQAFEFGGLLDHHVIVRMNDTRMEMLPGASRRIGDGQLVYHGVRQWMGYNVYYDSTRSWMIAACLVAIFSMALHFLHKFRSSPII